MIIMLSINSGTLVSSGSKGKKRKLLPLFKTICKDKDDRSMFLSSFYLTLCEAALTECLNVFSLISRVLAHTNFKKNKQAILSYLFLIYYVVYAVSPLSYTFSAKKVVDSIDYANRMSAPLSNLSIFLLEVICAKIDPIKAIDHTNSAGSVLIRKSRAILPENTSLKLTPSENLLLLVHIIQFIDNYSPRLLVPYYKRTSRHRVNPLHSGHAPPLA